MTGSEDFIQLQRYFQQGITLRMLEDMSKEDLQNMASFGWQKMNEGLYQQARNIFYVLVYCDHYNGDYLLTLALCYQKLGDHHAALLALSQAGTILVTDPRPPFLAAQSYRQIGMYGHEKQALKTVLMLAHNQLVWQDLRRDAAEQLARCPTESIE